jgi:sugar-phosphatase
MASSPVSSPVLVHCKAILFDMDGILISSIASVERSWTTWAHLRGVDAALARETAHGRRAVETIALLRPDLDPEEELKVIEDIEIADNECLTVLPGVLELLAALPADRWTVVTSATERLARIRMDAGGIPVPRRLVTADRVTRGKPHPEPFLAGAALLGAAPQECVVFEDSASGAQAGRDAGCTVVATTFSHPAESLDAAHYLVRDLTGVSAEMRNAEIALHLFLRWDRQ